MKILIIGGSGFVGTRLIDVLIKDHEVGNLDKNNSHFFPEITVIKDIRDTPIFTETYEVVILLAAEHRDDVSPVSLYYDVNVTGTRNVLEEMRDKGMNKIIFTSSVAVYGLNKPNPDEHYPVDPFNHYGKSKWQAEEILRDWYNESPDERSLTIIRPTVIFGERNRGNVYNLLRQIAKGMFLMVGNGKNEKSMAYVGNVSSFIAYQLQHTSPGYRVYNYVDKPDLNMNELLSQVEQCMSKRIPSLKIPYVFGFIAGLGFDLLAKISGRSFSISSVRIKKFCATTQFDAHAAHHSGFKAPFTLAEGLRRTISHEFIDKIDDGIVFESE
jgi:nucleoside-diphosphate-sugar epimerase